MKAKAYYNEFKPEAAHMLRQLIKDGLIADGDVDERSILDVRPEDLRGYTQCHFFAGIGGWSVALRLAGWPDDRPVWTGSCPCQPFSTAGNQKGQKDERHLWPVWSKLITEIKPSVVFGEQVASAISHGWLDGVYTDLEGQGYFCGSAVLPACSVNAPHKRDRLWFVGDRSGSVCQRDARELLEAQGRECSARQPDGNLHLGSEHAGESRACGLADAASAGLPQRRGSEIFESRSQQELERCSEIRNIHVGNATSERCGETGQYSSRSEKRIARTSDGCSRDGNMVYTKYDGRNGSTLSGGNEEAVRDSETWKDSTGESAGAGSARVISDGVANNAIVQGLEGYGRPIKEHDSQGRQEPDGHSATSSFWDDYEWLLCGDGKIRRIPTVESGICIVAHGIQRRAPLLHAFGNAIVPEVAARFIQACM